MEFFLTFFSYLFATINLIVGIIIFLLCTISDNEVLEDFFNVNREDIREEINEMVERDAEYHKIRQSGDKDAMHNLFEKKEKDYIKIVNMSINVLVGFSVLSIILGFYSLILIQKKYINTACILAVFPSLCFSLLMIKQWKEDNKKG